MLYGIWAMFRPIAKCSVDALRTSTGSRLVLVLVSLASDRIQGTR